MVWSPLPYQAIILIAWQGTMKWKDKYGNTNRSLNQIEEDIRKSLSVGNWLKLYLIIAICLLVIMLCLIYFNTGIIGTYLARAIC